MEQLGPRPRRRTSTSSSTNHAAYLSFVRGRRRRATRTSSEIHEQARARPDRPDLHDRRRRRCWPAIGPGRHPARAPGGARLERPGRGDAADLARDARRASPGRPAARGHGGRSARSRCGCQSDKIASCPVVYTSEFPFVYLCADVVAFSVRADDGSVRPRSIKRGQAPTRAAGPCPGGFVDENEDVAQGRAARAARRRPACVVGRRPFEQLGAYAAPKRDPRHRVVSMSYWPLAGARRRGAGRRRRRRRRTGGRVDRGAVGAARLAFDHATILADALDALGRAMETTDPGRLAARRGVHGRRAARRLRGGVGARRWTRATSSARCSAPRASSSTAGGAPPAVAGPPRRALHRRRGRRDLAADVAPARPLTRARPPTRTPDP